MILMSCIMKKISLFKNIKFVLLILPAWLIFISELQSATVKKTIHILNIWESIQKCNLSITNQRTNFYIKILKKGVGIRDARHYFIVNGQRGEEYDDITLTTNRINNHYLVYWGYISGKWYLIFNNKREYRGFDKTSPIIISQDGKKYAYTVNEYGTYYIYINKEKYTSSFNKLRVLNFSPDGDDIYYAMRDQGMQHLMKNKRRILNRYDYIGDVYFSSRGRIIYWAKKDNALFIFKDHFLIETRPFSDMSDVTGFKISNDGSLAYMKNKYPNKALNLNGVDGPTYKYIKGLCFSPDSSHFAYIAGNIFINNRYEYFLMRDNRQGKIYPGIDKRVVFSPDSKHLIYHAVNVLGNSVMVLDGKEYVSETGILVDWGFVFTGKKYEYFAVIRDKTLNYEYIVLGGKKGRNFSKIYKGIYYDVKEKCLIYPAREYNNIYLVREKYN